MATTSHPKHPPSSLPIGSPQPLARFAEQGIEAVRVELLARDLNVSKGSFYWHFRDRNDLLERLLDDWERSRASVV